MCCTWCGDPRLTRILLLLSNLFFETLSFLDPGASWFRRAGQSVNCLSLFLQHWIYRPVPCPLSSITARALTFGTHAYIVSPFFVFWDISPSLYVSLGNWGSIKTFCYCFSFFHIHLLGFFFRVFHFSNIFPSFTHPPHACWGTEEWGPRVPGICQGCLSLAQ